MYDKLFIGYRVTNRYSPGNSVYRGSLTRMEDH